MPPTQLARRFLRGQTFREWFVEFLQFCTVGLGAYVVDVGLFNLLAHTGLITLPGDQSMTAKIISVTVSVIFSWVANRLWTFKEKRSADKTREFAMFVLVNLGGMLIALGCLAFSRYTLGLTSQFADNVSANVVGLILGTAFRYVMYRYVVFSPGSLERPAGEEAAGARAATRWQEPRERAAESVAPPSGP
ncbi:MAG: GtrA family protein [Peptidiphaga sp.]